ncbi:TIGR00659 family protein [Lachnospira multipara]|uniref:TIGR00659 family protein n=2 Tax=Lachnospira multipara TaxID=28051 RepID=A0A1H5XBX3_9FIRM|nr:LrgB family protein [Lachnospira multipara]SEG09251.1 TIGR00659 family protein [Lachnospira multipara]
MEVLESSVFFGVTITLITYAIGVLIKKKLKIAIFNPLLISIALIIIFLAFTGIDYQSYSEGADFISYLLTPATVCLAVPMYEQMDSLKKNGLAIMTGVLSGTITSMLCVLACTAIFKLNHETYVTLLPKSITTAIGIGVSEEMGGVITITIVAIIVTGIFGNMFAELICKLFKIQHPIAKGVAIGTSSHAMGTSKAMELGEVEGAISSLSLAVAGILTVILAPLFASIL